MGAKLRKGTVRWCAQLKFKDCRCGFFLFPRISQSVYASVG